MVSSFVAVRMHVAGAKYHYQAVSIAREKMEDIIQAGICAGASSEADQNVTIDSASGLTGVRSVTYSPDPATDNVTVSVKVTWSSPSGGVSQEQETLVLFLNTI